MERTVSAVLRSRRTVVTVLAAVVAACLLVVASAWADPAGAKKGPAKDRAAAQDNPLRYETQDYSPPQDLPGFQVVKVTAKCQEGYSVIGGGFDQHLDAKADRWNLVASRPAFYADDGVAMQGAGWVVEAYKDIFDKPGPFTVYAVCAPTSLDPPSARGVSYYRTSNLISGGAKTTDVTPYCPAGDQAIGGGFSFRGGSGSDGLTGNLIRSQPNLGEWPHSWLVTGYKQSGTVRVFGYVVCDSQPNNVVGLNRQEAATTQFRNPINVSSPRCPDGTYLLGGGAGVPNNSDGLVDWSHIRPGSGNQSWDVGAYNNQVVSKLTVYSYAMCGKLRGSNAGGGGSGKLSGKNPGWGDGEGGGRSREQGKPSR